ncbi:DUF1735 domain-containing protein [Pedobacter sp. MR2016-19]|uniref:DUF1735 domain-containing protein n=1 Tax=Pedobacter sp. MR2016-19 TaxID=2780089 RepID=UPI001875268E|nr:DUF1735 domain-containing protein [Pedobacter sp. MR2016-19]MBE5320746.1 DUF1735 domain-containing protein [Pedobacter sp. MR2016-19]
MSYKTYYNIPGSMLSFKGALLFTLLLLGIAACKKNTSDADGLQSRFDSGMVSYVQGSNVVRLNGKEYNFTPYYVGVPVRLKEAVNSVDTITAVVDPSMVTQYNQLYQEKNPTISGGAFEVSHKGKFPFASGDVEAKDSLYVLLKDGSQLKDSTIYLVPVTLSSKQGANLKYSLFFFKVLVTKGDLQAKIYGATVGTGVSLTRLTSGALQVNNIGTLRDSLKLRITLNKVFPANDVSVQASFLTQSEIAAAITKEKFVGTSLTEANTIFTKNLVTVPARALLSKDSISVGFINRATLKSGWYITGVKIITYTGSAYGVPPVANDSCRAYLRFFK